MSFPAKHNVSYEKTTVINMSVLNVEPYAQVLSSMKCVVVSIVCERHFNLTVGVT